MRLRRPAGAHEVWYLLSNLARPPLVVVVAEGHQVATSGQDAGVASAGQPRLAIVSDDAQRPPGVIRREGRIAGPSPLVRAVEHDEALDVGVVALRIDAAQRPGEELGPAPRWDHDRHRRPAWRVEGALGAAVVLWAKHRPINGRRPPVLLATRKRSRRRSPRLRS